MIYTYLFYLIDTNGSTASRPHQGCGNSQTGPSVGCMLNKILHYGFCRPDNFNKYEALRLSEQLAASARLASNPKAPSYEVIASTLRQKIGSPVDQFKAYFSALLADKEYCITDITKITDVRKITAITKITDIT